MGRKNGLITFCILHTSRLNFTKRCIGSIERYTHVKYCVKVLRQGYTDEEAEMYFKSLEKRDNFQVIRLARNIGPPAGRRVLLTKTKTPLVMTLDNDVYLTNGWLKPVLEILENHEDIGIVGIPRYKTNGEFVAMGGRRIHIVNNVFYIETPKFDERKNKDFILVDDVVGGVMLFRREVKSDFAYDPRYFIGFGDLDKGFQLLSSRWKKVVCLRTRVIEDQTVKDLNYSALRMNYPEISRSYAKFRKKWGLRLSWRKHFTYKYVYPFILPSLHKTLKKVNGMLIHPHLSH